MGDITAADLKSVLNHWMEQGYAYTTVKKVHILLNEYFRYLKQEDGTIKSLTPRQVADLLGHSTSQITELYYVKKDTSRLHGITDGFNL